MYGLFTKLSVLLINDSTLIFDKIDNGDRE